VRGTQILRQNRAKELQNSRTFGAPRAHKKCVHSASVRCANHSTSMQIFIGRHACGGRPRRVMHNYSAVAPTREVEKEKKAFLRAKTSSIQKSITEPTLSRTLPVLNFLVLKIDQVKNENIRKQNLQKIY
jgi:hypothetical protein